MPSALVPVVRVVGGERAGHPDRTGRPMVPGVGLVGGLEAGDEGGAGEEGPAYGSHVGRSGRGVVLPSWAEPQ